MRETSIQQSHTRTGKKGKPSASKAKAKAEQLEGKVKKAERQIIKQAEELAPEQEYLQEYLYMYRSLKQLARQAKRSALESGSGRNYYAYCTLLSQQREVIADIRTMIDMSGQVDLIVNDVLQPMTQSIGQALLNMFYQLRALVKETTNPKETQFANRQIEALLKDVSKALQGAHNIAAANTHNILVGKDGK